MRPILLSILFICSAIASVGQAYQTKAGTLKATGSYKGASVFGVSNHLHIHINYDRAEMHFRLLIPTIISTDDSLNNLLQHMTGQEIHFAGKMNMNYVQTKSHPKQKFTTQGSLMINGLPKPFTFVSLLEHFPKGRISCILSGEFIINLEDFGIKTLPGENKVNVSFNQVVMKKTSE